MNSKRLLRRPQRKLALSYAIMIGFLYIFIGVDTYYFTSRHHDRTIEQEIIFIANTIHNQLEPKLFLPDRIDPSIQEIFPDFCIVPACQPKTVSQRHIANTFSATDRYYLVLVDNTGKIRATAGSTPTTLSFQKLNSREAWMTWQDPQGKSYRQYAIMIHGHGLESSHSIWGKLYIGRNTEDLSNSLQSLQTGLIFGLPLVLVAIGGISWYLADRAMRPLYLAYEQQQVFAANVAHELRTPLAIDRLNIDKYIAKFDREYPPAAIALNELRSQNIRLASIVTDLLLLAQLERTNLNAEERSVCILDEVVEDVIEELSVLHNCHRISVNIPPRIQPVEIGGDRERIIRLVYNLVENALKYTPSGGTIAISIERNPRYHILQVSDSGVGIAAEELGHIFDRFHRSKSTQKTTGMGLGLAIVRAIANLYGAKVRVRSQIGRGSTFSVEFPRKFLHEVNSRSAKK
jgi:signal transduction histidine kinase